EIIKNISKGKVYQVNLSQKFTLPFDSDPLQLFYSLSAVTPAAYSSFCNFSGKYILSSSPELFLSNNSEKLVTSPIKGTKLIEKDGDGELHSL
ncbi:chorismate-binding protein, partial [Salmonella sp. s50237]|uniref:chorismate-binding protein n=1 Tax=Salmonella sp. s50237 TaxID=3159649 RepID=UPI00397FFF51